MILIWQLDPVFSVFSENLEESFVTFYNLTQQIFKKIVKIPGFLCETGASSYNFKQNLILLCSQQLNSYRELPMCGSNPRP